MCRKDCPFRFKFFGKYFCSLSIDFFDTFLSCTRISKSLCQFMRFQYSQFFSEYNKDNHSSKTN